ncbi:MAG: LysE family transporter [Roseobacter sp.]
MASAEMLIPLWAVLLGWMVMGGSPGPATLAISGTSMRQGRLAGLTLAAGIVVGSASWGIMAALGFSAVMMAHVWLFETVRYLGAAYLFYLAIKSLRAAWRGGAGAAPQVPHNRLFAKGLLLHLTNPKAILGWGAVFSVALVPGSGPLAVWGLFSTLICASMTVFFGYALLFSWGPIARGYSRARRGFELVFGLLFGAASFQILTARLT